MAEIDRYVREHAGQITPAVLEKLLAKLPLLKMEFTQIEAPGFPRLFEQLEFLADVVEDFAEGADREIPYVTVAEAAFALLSVHKHLGLLPEKPETAGHADDSTVVRAVLTSNREALASYAARHDVPWAGALAKP